MLVCTGDKSIIKDRRFISLLEVVLDVTVIVTDARGAAGDNRMDKVISGAIEMTWDDRSRLASITFERETRSTGEDARTLIDALTRWIGTEYKPFSILGDGSKLAGVDAEYRSVWGRFFQEHRGNSYIAFFNMSPVIHIAAEMFGIGTELRPKAFGREEQVHSWLRGMGIPA